VEEWVFLTLTLTLYTSQTAYELVLHAFLLAPADHERLLALLRAWPPALYSIPALTEAVVQRRARRSPQLLASVVSVRPAWWWHTGGVRWGRPIITTSARRNPPGRAGRHCCSRRRPRSGARRPWPRAFARTRRIRGPGGDSDALLQAAAHLYQLAGRFDLALAILLRLRRADAFGFITQHGLLPLLRPAHIAALVRIDEARPRLASSARSPAK